VGVRTVSRQRARRARARAVITGRAIPETCPLCQRGAVDETHELVNRSQRRGVETEIEFMIRLCHTCHRWVTTHREMAWRVGLVIWGWEARQDKDAAIAAAQARWLDYQLTRPVPR
jgi:hypothetical protein